MFLDLKKYLSILFGGVLLFGILHFLLASYKPHFFGVSIYDLSTLYVFLFLLNVVHFIGLKFLFAKWPKYAGFLFTALSMGKMFICILFLATYIFPATPKSTAMVFNFMALYFFTLFIEVSFIAKNMNKA